MIRTKVTQTLALAGFIPAGKPSYANGQQRSCHNALGQLDWSKRACAVFVLCATTVIALPAQTFTTLHSFDGTDGGEPLSLVQATDGNFYGATFQYGANGNYGTVFKITPSGALTTLYNFCSLSQCTDGIEPNGVVQGTDGNFYGTTYQGGGGGGTVFRITPSGTLTTLYTFCAQSVCPDGYDPVSGIIQGTDGNFYGTTPMGGDPGCLYGCGTVFKITPSGTLTTLYNFCSQSGCPDGSQPYGALVRATNGDFYGVTDLGGANSQGTVFKITPGGTLTTLYNFCSQIGCTDGSNANQLVQATDGSFYGTTYSGGTNNQGTVFKITPSGTLTTLYSFCSQTGCPDGDVPVAALVQATDGNFYGTTTLGGANNQGTVFKITPGGTLTQLHSFCSQTGCPDGNAPVAALVLATNGTFYGTTNFGGTHNDGTVFSLSVGLGPFVETQPTSGKVGAVVKILGTDLAGASSVSFNGTAAVFEVVSSSEIKATVPADATSGRVKVVTPRRTLSSNVPFRVRP
jgi:uncharacterized repeat protein (TIGR03803 family)